jgi:gamma-glutamyl phosphate reductase
VSSLYHQEERPRAVVSFIGGLGGKRISQSEFKYMLSVIETAAAEGKVPMHCVMLFTDQDWGMVKRMLKIAGKGEVND